MTQWDNFCQHAILDHGFSRYLTPCEDIWTAVASDSIKSVLACGPDFLLLSTSHYPNGASACGATSWTSYEWQDHPFDATCRTCCATFALQKHVNVVKALWLKKWFESANLGKLCRNHILRGVLFPCDFFLSFLWEKKNSYKLLSINTELNSEVMFLQIPINTLSLM